jgi:hypothetical protein
MTETVLKQIVQRAVRDGSFRAQLRSDPNQALAGYGITTEERSALASGDPTRLSALGVDQRMSKAYSAGLLSDASKVVAPNDATVGVADFIDEGSTGGTSVIVGDPASAAAAALEGTADWSARHMRMIEQDLDTAGNAAKVEPEMSPVWRVERDLDTAGAGASGTAAPIDGSPEASAFEAAPAAGSTGLSHLRQIEQDLDTGGASGTAAPIEGSPEQAAFDAAPADVQINAGDAQPSEY